jgi:DNA-binding FrmR family transcriptional regulator
MAKPQSATTTPSRGYSATKDQLLTRLARAEGQVRGVTGMIENERYCIDVLTQIAAIQAALDKISLGLLDDHARHCMQGKGAAPSDPEEQVDELIGAVRRLLHR